MNTTLKNILGLLIITLVIVILSGFKLFTPNIIEDELPSLYTSKNTIVRSDTDEQVILRGAVSDYFRYGLFNNKILQKKGLGAELSRLLELKKNSANLIGLYLSDKEMIQKNKHELDEYIELALHLKMYVYLMPVAREFNNLEELGDGSSSDDSFDDLLNLIDFLSSRYSEYVHVIYALGTEPSVELNTSDIWNTKQVRFSKIIQHNSPDAIIFITDLDTPIGLTKYIKNPFTYKNVVYFGGGYISADDEFIKNNPITIKNILKEELSQTYPYIAGEFGGNYISDFSSDSDLSIIQTILKNLNQNNSHYTMYKMSSNYKSDKLSIFDSYGNITARGDIFLNALIQSPPTQF